MRQLYLYRLEWHLAITFRNPLSRRRSVIPRSPCRFRSIREWVLCGAPEVPGAGRSCGSLSGTILSELRAWRPASWAAGLFKALYRLFVCRGVEVVFDRRNGTQVSARPFLIHLVHGNVPLQRFLDARHARQASGARRRLAGRTFGRGMGDGRARPDGRSGHDERE
jgi:hypothetical protein